MTRTHRLAIAALAATLLLGGCTSPGAGGSGSGGSTVAPTGGSASVAPGRTAHRGGRVDAVGTLARDASGAWVVLAAVPSQSKGAATIAIISNPSALQAASTDASEGAYVRISGTAANGIATDSSSLGVIVDRVELLPAR